MASQHPQLWGLSRCWGHKTQVQIYSRKIFFISSIYCLCSSCLSAMCRPVHYLASTIQESKTEAMRFPVYSSAVVQMLSVLVRLSTVDCQLTPISCDAISPYSCGGIVMKLGTNIHHVSGNCRNVFKVRGQRSRS